MPPTNQLGIARILLNRRPARKLGEPEVVTAGMGIAVDSRHILTCAHVVNAALDRKLSDVPPPLKNEALTIVFPLSTSVQPIKGRVVAWRAMNQTPIGDVAVIELETDVPEDAGMARFAETFSPIDAPLSITGCRFGQAECNPVKAELMGSVGPHHDQIDAPGSSGQFIERGYSGAGVWDKNREAVIGMVALREQSPDLRIAYLIRVSTLRSVWPTLLLVDEPENTGGEPAVKGWPELWVRELAETMLPLVGADRLDAIISTLPHEVRRRVEDDHLLELTPRCERLVQACVSCGQVPRLVASVTGPGGKTAEQEKLRETFAEIQAGIFFLPALRRATLEVLSDGPLNLAELKRLAGRAGGGPDAEGTLAAWLRAMAREYEHPPGKQGFPAIVKWLMGVATRLAKSHPTKADRLREMSKEIWTAFGANEDELLRMEEEPLDGETWDEEPAAPRRTQNIPGPEALAELPLISSATGVLFVPWTAPLERGQQINKIIADWQGRPDPVKRALVLVPHFTADVGATLLGAEVVLRSKRGATGFKVIKAKSVEKICAQLAELRTGRVKLLMLDFSELKLESAELGDRTLLENLQVARERLGCQTVIGLPRQLLAMKGINQLVDDPASSAFIAAALFSPEYELREPETSNGAPQTATETKALLRSTLAPLLRANSPALVQAIREVEAGDLDPFELTKLGAFPIWTLLRLAKQLARSDFLEPAYRLELYCRTRAQFQNSIALGADLLPIGQDKPATFSLVEPLEALPGFVARSILSGQEGSGRTKGLQRIAHWWALPRGALQGLRHPPWLPISIHYDPDDTPATALKKAFTAQLRYTEEVPFRAESLNAHAALSNQVPERLRWLTNSPVLLLVDGIGRDDANAGQWLEALNAQFSPDTGIVVTWDIRREPRNQEWVGSVFGRGSRARVRPLDEHQIGAMATNNDAAAKTLHKLLGRMGQPVAEAIRNPFLCALLCEAIIRGEIVEDWNLYEILASDVRNRVGAEPDRDVRSLIDKWLPEAALAEIEGNRIPVKPEQQSLARELRLAGANSDLQFAYSMLRDYFAARRIAKNVLGNPAPNSFAGWIDKIRSAAPEDWVSDLQLPLRILVGGYPEFREPVILALADRDEHLALKCAREVPLKEARGLTAKIAEHVANGLQVKLGSNAEIGELDISASVQAANALGPLDPRIGLAAANASPVGAEIPNPIRFWMGKFPVTNIEFARFVEAGGYSEQKYWSAPGWEWSRKEKCTTPRYWLNVEFNQPNAPVVGISIHEGMAYCAWLNESGAKLAVANSGQWSLPTSEQWDRSLGVADAVLLGALRAKYSGAPKEHAPQDQILLQILAQLDAVLSSNPEFIHSASFRNKYGSIPVGLFPANGNGCHDMLGLVWEWCVPAEVGIEESGLAWVKGGPLRNSAAAFWSLYGGFIDPQTRFHEIGFRICYSCPN